jgi:hypothetical protein
MSRSGGKLDRGFSNRGTERTVKYQTIYEIAGEPFQGIVQMVLVSPILMVIVSLLVAFFLMVVFAWTPLYDYLIRKYVAKFQLDQRVELNYRLPVSAFFLATLLVFVLIIVPRYGSNRQLEAAYREGKLAVVEGIVQDFHFSGGYKMAPGYVKFRIADREIRYTPNACGFALTKDGVVTDGERVRLWLRDQPGSKTSEIANTNPSWRWSVDDSIAIARVDVIPVVHQ